VSAGSAIGFTVTLTNSGNAAATTTKISDLLPPGSGVNWSVATSSDPSCAVSGSPPSQTLNCGPETLAAGASITVHVTSSTTVGASCGTYNNTASFTSANGGTGMSSASVTVTCPTACSGSGSITSNFNGTKIPGGDYIWFNSVANVKGAVNGTRITLTGSQAVFTANSTPYTVAMPTAVIVFSSSASQATTVYDTIQNAWVTTVPLSYAGNAFSGGVPFLVPAAGLPAGINPVVWSWHMTSSTAGVSLMWQWAAAVYSQFTTNLNAIGVKPIDGPNLNAYKNGDHAGTPENFTKFVVGGARGGGGGDYTGSYSGTQAVTCK
jgi:uncharacterized repeat protein (TIGR01451 family)